MVQSISLKSPGPGAAHTALASWALQNTPDPVLPGDEETSSPLVGKDAGKFKLPMLGGGAFTLADSLGKVIVLDFWATWCGPCVKSLPGLIEQMSGFPDDKVVFLAVNQAESEEQVQQFLDARELMMPVAFDADGKVARTYGVDGIPHTVVIDRDGKVAFVKTGYETGDEKKIAAAVRKALGSDGAETPGKPSDSPADPRDDALPGDGLLPPPDLN
jgi:peroxiredoxin